MSSSYFILNFSDTNHGNVLYHEHSGVLTNAHFVDWGLAKHVTKDHDGKIDAASAAAIVSFFFSYLWLLC
jgi:hypothetical protein